MKTILSIVVSSIAILGFATTSWADGHGHLDKSGTIHYHTGFACLQIECRWEFHVNCVCFTLRYVHCIRPVPLCGFK